jgi:hypothetical protein
MERAHRERTCAEHRGSLFGGTGLGTASRMGMKRIIDGKTHNTDSTTIVAEGSWEAKDRG